MFSGTPEETPDHSAATCEKSRFTWKQCLWLCLPALVIGAVIRIWVLSAIPEGSYSADSASYFETTRKLLVKHEFIVAHKRRWLYPLVLIPTYFIPPSPVRVIPVIQHIVGLVTIFGIGWIVGHLTRLRALWVPAVTVLFALWPRVLWYEHEILAEGLFLSAFVLLAALAVPAGSLKDRRRLMWFLLAAALMVSLKPHGRGIYLAATVTAVFVAGMPWKWGWKCWAAFAVGAVVIETSGSKSQGNWLLLSSTLPLVQTEGEKWKEYREALKPLVLETRADGPGYAWMQENYKKRLSSSDPSEVSPAWAALTRDRGRFSDVCGTLSREALLTHPVKFAQFVGLKCLIAIRAEYARGNFRPEIFWEKQDVIAGEFWKKNAREMRMMYGLDEAGYAALSAEGRTRQFGAMALLDWVAWNFSVVEADFDEKTRAFSLKARWMGVLALLGLAACMTPRRFGASMILWLSLGLYCATVFAVGDRVPRFIHAVEWVNWVLAAIALDVILCGAWCAVRRILPRNSLSPGDSPPA